MTESKTLDVTSSKDFKDKIPAVKVTGDPDLFQLMSKASHAEQGWMKSTKACEVPGGCVVQVTTQQGDQVAEALCFVPGIQIGMDEQGRPAFKSLG